MIVTRFVMLALGTILVSSACGPSSGGANDDAPGGTPTSPADGASPGAGSPADSEPNGSEAPGPETTDSNGDHPGRIPAPDARTASYCEEDWRRYTTNQKVGLTKAYERRSKSTGVIATESRRVWRETVTSVTADAVTLERIEQTTLPRLGTERRTSRTVTKSMRFSDCLGIATTTDPTVSTEDIERREEELQVAAGTFATTYAKTRETGTDESTPYELLSDTWTIKGALEVVAKAVTVYKTTKNGEPFTEESVMELTELTLP